MMAEHSHAADVDGLARDELLTLWLRLFGSPAPAKLGPTLLRRFIAFELQARRRGGLPLAHRRRLASLAAGRARPKAPLPAAGARLLREWNGITHVVDITPTGCSWQGREFRSLSAVAREITGAHWSGPRFFGLSKVEGFEVAGAAPQGTARTPSGAGKGARP